MTADIQQLISRGRRRRERLPSPPVRRHLREQAGLTQQDVSDFLGVSRPSLTRYELGTREPRGRVRDEYQALLKSLTAESTS